MAKGTDWKNVKTTGFIGEIKKLHKSYVDTIDNANVLAGKLRDNLKAEWQSKYPDGVEGKVAAFKISNGSIQYAMVDAKEMDTGDDIFALK